MWGGAGMGRWTWMVGTRNLMRSRGLAEYWNSPILCSQHTKDSWKDKVYDRVEAHFESERDTKAATLTSLSRYVKLKSWERVDSSRAAFVGEVGQHGALAVERYLDEVRDRLG